MMEAKASSVQVASTENGSLKVLVVEDNPNDALLLIRELEKSGFDLNWRRVDTKAAFLQALKDDYDLVLSDYSLPQFNGLEALQLLRERKLNTPFLLISGAIGDETAVEAIKCGAQDYLLKDRLTRLGAAVFQALRNKELQEQAALAEQQKDRLLVDLESRVRQMTALQQVFHIVGQDECPEGEVFQQVVDALPQGWRFPHLAVARITVDGRVFISPAFEDTPHKLSAQFETACGRTGLVELGYLVMPASEKGEPHLPEEKQLLRTVAEILQRYLDRRLAKQRLSRHALVLANVHDAAIVTDTQGVVTFWNEAATQLFGWTADEMIGRHYADRFSEELRPWLKDQMQQRLAGGEWSGEYEDYRKDGSRVWIDARVSPVRDDSGQIVGILGISRDVTERKLAEAKQRENENRYRNIVESSHDLIWSINSNGVITYMNQAARWIFGREPEEMIGRNFRDFVPPEQFERDSACFTQAMTTGAGTLDYESQVYRKDGSIVRLSANASVVYDRVGKMVGATGISRDMSNHYELTESIRKRETLLANAERIAQIGSWEYDILNDELRWSANTLRIFGIEDEKFEGTLEFFLEKIHPDDRAKELEALAAADSGNRIIDTEYRILRGINDLRVIRERGEVIFDYSGKAIRRTGVVLDVTKEYQDNEALRKSEERFQLAVQGASAGLWDWDIRTDVVYYSTRFKELLGYSDDEFPNVLSAFDDALHPKDRTVVDKALREHFRKGNSYDVDYRLRTKQGKYRWFKARGAVLRDESGEPYRMAGSLVDIHSQKKLERDLLARERRLQELVAELSEERRRLAEAQAVAKVGCWETDAKSLNVIWTDETHRIFETDPQSFQPTHAAFLSLVHPEDRSAVDEAFQRSLHHSEVCRIEHRILLPNGRIKFIEETWRNFRDSQGLALRAVGTCRDITEAKKAEARVAAQAKRFEAVGSIGRSFLEHRSLLRSLPDSVDRLTHYLDLIDARIWLVSDDQQKLTLQAFSNSSVTPVGDEVLISSNLPLAEVVKEKRTIILNCSSNASCLQYWRCGVEFYAAYPLVGHGKCYGALELFLDYLPDLELNTAHEIIASTIALNIARAHSEESLARLNEQLEHRVQERTGQLIESSRRHETLLSNLQGMAYRRRLDVEGTMEYVSAGCFALLGVDSNELKNGVYTLISMIHPDDRAMVAAAHASGIATGRPIIQEYRIVRPDGILKWVLEQARRVYDQNRKLEAIEGFITDITDSKLANLREQHQNKFYQLLTSGASLRSCLEQIACSVEQENPSFCCFAMLLDDAKSTLHLAAAPSLPDSLKQKLTNIPVRVEGVRIQVVGQLDSNLQFDKPVTWDQTAFCQSLGSSEVHSHLAVPIGTASNQAVVGSLNICSFSSAIVGERDRDRLEWAANLANLAIQHLGAKQNLIDNEAFIRTTLDAISGHIAVLDSTGKIVTTNQAWRSFAAKGGGAESACITDANYLDVCHRAAENGDEQAASVESAIRAILNGEMQEWSCEYSCPSPIDNSWYLLQVRGFKVGTQNHCLVAHEDVTAVKRTEEQLREIAKAAKHASMAKSEFLTTMSHELRTLLNGILGMNQLLLATELSDQQRQYAEASNSSGRLLLNLINDILDLSKIEAGKLELELREFDLFESVTSVCNTMRFTAKAKGLYLNCELSPALSAVAMGDENRLRQILVNLVGNAVKFTTSGGVTLKGALVSKSDQPSRVRFEVIDTGIGVPAERRDRLFQAFSQVDSSTTRQFGGTGLGLSICKQLVELMGGIIGVDSEVERGSHFWFELPLQIKNILSTVAIASAAAVPSATTSRASPALPLLVGHVLVAEDNRINQLYITDLLKNFGCTCKVATNGDEAVTLIAKESFDIVLMDCQMPEMDGFAATRLIRERERASLPVKHVPILALTANALKGDRERCLEAGMDDYIRKPIEAEDMHALLAKYLSRAKLRSSLNDKLP